MSNTQAQALFLALADPTRRQILQRLAEEGAATATRLTVGLSITRQAVTKHLNALADAGLLTSKTAGRERQYHLQPEPLQEVTAWIAQIEALWNRKLDALQAHLLQPEASDGKEDSGSRS